MLVIDNLNAAVRGMAREAVAEGEPVHRATIQVTDLACFPRTATVYGIRELARRAGVSAEMFRTWRIEFRERGFTDVYVEPSSGRRIRFPQADLSFWEEIYRGKFRTSTVGWMRDPGARLSLVPDFKVPFSSARHGDIGPLFAETETGCVACALDLPISVLLTLSRFEETFAGPRDVHGRFTAVSSIAWREGFIERPIVDEYGLALEQVVSHLLPGWRPVERHLRVKLGHDVDEIGIPFSFRTAVGHTVRRGLPLATLRDIAAPWTGISTAYEELLRDIVDLSLERDLKSAVYWKAQPSGANRAAYDIGSKRVRKLVAGLSAKGIEMGVHPSYDSFGSVERLRVEVSAVRDLLQQDRMGGRQDFLRWSPQTWIDWEAVGLAYDATVGFADHVGFRAGTSYPYRPWLLSRQREADLLEIPLMAMDSTAQGYMRLSPEEALKTLLKCVARCRVVGGVFSLLWHNTRLIGPGYAKVYLGLLDELTGSASYDWRASRDSGCWN